MFPVCGLKQARCKHCRLLNGIKAVGSGTRPLHYIAATLACHPYNPALHQVANRNSLSVRMDEIKFGQFISANIGFFAASYLVFYPAELLKTRQQVL